MEVGKTTLERAFELARSGRFGTVSELKLAVVAEGYDRKQLEGSALSRQLAALIKSMATPTYRGPTPRPACARAARRAG